MAAKNVVADLTRGDKLTGNNYDIWHRKIQYLLNEQELLETLSSKMTIPEDGNTAQHKRDLEAYQSWFKKDRSTRFTMLSSMHDDLIGEYETFQNAKDMWDQLKFDFGGTSTTRLRSLVLKFEVYRKDPKHTMTEHLRMMSGMIRDLKAAGNVLTDEQQVQAVIRSLPDSWISMKQIMTHNENIKNFADISRHVELEAERQEATKSAALIAMVGNANKMSLSVKTRARQQGRLGYDFHLSWNGLDILLDDVIFGHGSSIWHARLGHIGKDRMARKPFGKAMRATQPLELIHSNICEPMNVKARHGASYFLTFIDDYTRYGYVQLIAHRYEALDCFKRFVAEVENQHDVAERRNRTLLNMVRSMMAQANLPISFWGDALLTVAYILNRVPSQSVSSTPYELWKGEKPNLEHLRPWGSAGFVHSTTHKYGKLGPRARKHIFIRYSDSSKGYVMYGEHPNGGMTKIESRDIDFIETDFPSIGNANRDLDLYDESDLQPSGSITLDQDSQARRVSSRGHIPRRHFEIEGNVLLCDARDVDEPASFNEALHSPDRDEWMIAMSNARQMVQLTGTRRASWRKAILNERDLELFQMDVKTAFLNGELDEEIYMAQPEAGNDMDSIVTTKKWLSSTFEMKDMGETYALQLGMVSRYQSNPGPAHWRAVKRILRYLRGTSDHALCYHGGDLRLTDYSDADWASDKDECKSTSGYAFILGGGAVSWCSKKQSCIALSTMESEYVACSAAVQEVVWLRRFLQRLGVTAHAEDVVLLYSDSISALAYAKDPKYHGNAKHIELRYHYI
uniref:Retroviral polymerase SH3-like domain-containing protein n=1 Tax=Fagus sylvatica TaxID=28930 RepID=A0A2N9ERH0_FAGSY